MKTATMLAGIQKNKILNQWMKRIEQRTDRAAAQNRQELTIFRLDAATHKESKPIPTAAI
jgi:hypothetical protein